MAGARTVRTASALAPVNPERITPPFTEALRDGPGVWLCSLHGNRWTDRAARLSHACKLLMLSGLAGLGQDFRVGGCEDCGPKQSERVLFCPIVRKRRLRNPDSAATVSGNTISIPCLLKLKSNRG